MKTYTPKLERGQMAWFMKDSKAVQHIIGSIVIFDVGNEEGEETYVSITYRFRKFDIYKKFKTWDEYDEADVFGTKEELLASLYMPNSTFGPPCHRCGSEFN